MKIHSLRCRNFLSFGTGDVELLDMDSLTNIVGPNNSGKTNIFRAINLVGEALRARVSNASTSASNPAAYYHGQELEDPFEIGIRLQFEPNEIEALCSGLVCSSILNSNNRVPSLGNTSQPNFEPMKNALLDKFGTGFFRPLFDQEFWITVRGSSSEFYPPEIVLSFHQGESTLYGLDVGGVIANVREFSRGYTGYYPGDLLVEDLVSQDSQFGEYITGKRGQPSIPESYVPPDVFQMFAKVGGATVSIALTLYRANVGQLEPRYKTLASLHRLRGHYRSMNLPFSAKTPLGLQDVLTGIFLGSTVFVSDIRGTRGPAYLEAAEALEFPSHHLTSDILSSVLFRLRNSEFIGEKKQYDEVKKVFGKLTGGTSFDVVLRAITIQEPPTNQLVSIQQNPDSSALNIIPTELNASLLGLRTERQERTIHEFVVELRNTDISTPLDLSAGGIAESLLLATAIGGQNGKTILLDEPGQRMHPTLQRNLLELIHESIENRNNQFLIITHSPYLLRGEDVGKTWRLRMTDKGSVCINMGKTLGGFETSDRQSIQRYLKSADIRALLFSRGVVLVEGISDRIVIEKVDEFLSLTDRSCNLAANEWSVIDVGGKNSLATFVRLCIALDLQFAVVGDYDALMEMGTRTAMPDGSTYRTSAILRALILGKLMDNEEITKIKELDTKIETIGERKWYTNECLGTLVEFARKHHVFVFTKDLEGALQSNSTKKESKPLRALEEITRRMNEGEVSDEFEKMGASLKAWVLASQAPASTIV